MKRSWDLKPNLLDCILEERIAPAIANLGVIVVTTSGLSLVTPFPGASNNASGSRRHADHGGERERGGDADEFLHHGQSRDLVVHARQLHGESVGRRGGGRLEWRRGSDDPGRIRAPIRLAARCSTAASSRTNPASDGATAPIMAYIGSGRGGLRFIDHLTGQQSGGPDADRSRAVIARHGRRDPGLPGRDDRRAGASPMNQQFGAPRLLRGLGSSLTPALPGGLGVGSLTSPSGPGGY